jgi:hypothetical protein
MSGPLGWWNTRAVLNNTGSDEELSMSTAHSTLFPPCVYFVCFNKSGPIKIGKTRRDPHERLAGLQNGCPKRLHILGVIENPSEEQSEKALHQRFASLRIAGEWFRATDELKQFIAENAIGVDDQPRKQPCGQPRSQVRGRPRHATDPRKRSDQYRFTYLVRTGWLSRDEAARAADVTPWTISRWLRELLASDEPEAEELRRIKRR